MGETPFCHYRHGFRVPFDPRDSGLSECCLCGWPMAVVGVFTPQTDELKTALLKLRTKPLLDGRAVSAAYALCGAHSHEPRVTDRVEKMFLAHASKVTVQ